jgi:predicted kinase
MLKRHSKLLVIAGPPCSGKSTLAEAIEKRLRYRWLSIDRILGKLIPNSDHGETDRDIAYRAVHLLANELLRVGCNILVDATYGRAPHREAVAMLATTSGVSVYLIECRVSPEIAAARFRKRTYHPAVDLDESRVCHLASQYRYSGQGLIIDAEMPLSDALEQSIAYLANGKPIDGSGRLSGRGD